MAQVDYFLKMDGIKGESNDAKHKEEIELESWSWGVTQSGTSAKGSGSGAGKAVAQDLHFIKKHDQASPVLFASCATGKHFPNAVLTARKAGGEQQEYLTIKMSDLLVSSYQVGGSQGGDVVPTDQVSLNFSKIEFIYKPQKPDGTLGADVKQGYDFSKNVKL